MSDADVTVREGDLYTRVLEAIQAGDIYEAVKLINDVRTPSERIALARDLALDRTLARDLDLDRARALALAHALDLDLDRGLDRARALALAHARALALDLANTTSQVILYVLDDLLKNETLHAVPAGEITDPVAVRIIFTGIDVLTPHVLGGQVVPYLQALVDIEEVIAELRDEAAAQPRIRSISQRSPVTALIEGVASALGVLHEDIIPWRRRHAQQQAALDEARVEVEIDEIRLRTRRAEDEAESDEERQLRLEERRLAVEEKRLALERQRLEIHSKQIALALSIIDKLGLNLTEEQRFAYAMRLLEPLKVITESPVEAQKPAPPSTLPEE